MHLMQGKGKAVVMYCRDNYCHEQLPVRQLRVAWHSLVHCFVLQSWCATQPEQPTSKFEEENFDKRCTSSNGHV
eukprot:2798790-Prorocentrum_lima.AAC.1